MALLQFDASQVDPEFGRENLPAGWYAAAIDESELKPTKDGTGAYLQVRFNILDAQYSGRKVFMRLNIKNTNKEAETIAFRQLSAIAHAVGVLHVQDSTQLHNIPMFVKVKVRTDSSGQYEAQNEISSVKSVAEMQSQAAPTAGAPAGAPMPAPPIAPPVNYAAPTPVMPAPVAPVAPVMGAPVAPQNWQNGAPVHTPPTAAPIAPAAPVAAPAMVVPEVPAWLRNGQQ